MKKTNIALLNTFKVRLSGLAATLLVAGGVWLAPSPSQADTQDDAAFTCASAVNVMDCIQQTGAGTPVVQQSSVTAVPINSQALGFTGPVSVGLRYDNYLAWILDVGYAQAFHSAAAAFKLSAGLNERRANVTLGYSITPKQQIKLTYEYLAQNLPFDYASGTINQWVNQNAMGGAYRYLLDHGMVRALELYGNYTKANSKELPEVEMYTDNVLTQIDYRRIAGGTQENVGGAVTLTPFKGTILKVGAGYSSLSFDTKWEDNEATAALAYNAEVSQLLTPTVLVSGGIGTTAAGSTYTAKVSKILPWSLEASLMGQYMAATSDIPGSTSVTAGLSYPAPKTYTNMFAQGIGNLKDWVQQPVIYNTRVLAKAEEKIVQVEITKKADIPAQKIPVSLSLTPVLETKDYFSFDPEAYIRIDYSIDSIVNKADKQPIDPSLNNLNLGFKYLDSYNSEIVSLSPTTQAMMPAGQDVIYTVSILAQGYRDTGVVSKLSIPFDLTVAVNNQLQAANWVSNPPLLPSATSTEKYTQTIVLNDPKYITPSFKGEDFTFDLVPPTNNPSAGTNNPNWITLTPDHKALTGDPNNTVPSTTDQQATVTLKATSLASGAAANPATKTLTIPITTSVKPPNWNTDSLPQATIGVVYSPSGSTTGYDLNPYSPNPAGFTTPVTINQQPVNPPLPSSAVTFSMHSPLEADDCQWLDIVDQKYLVSKNGAAVPTNATDCWVNVDVVVNNTNPPLNIASTQMLPKPKIKVVYNTFTPTWVDPQYGPNISTVYNDPNNIENNNFTLNLNTAVRSNIDGDTLTFNKGSTWGCPWLDISASGILTGTTPTTLQDDCSITIAVSSTKSPENSPQPLPETVHIAPNPKITFQPVTNGSLSDAVYNVTYTSDQPIPIISNRVGETLKIPFVLTSNSCLNSGVDFKVDDNNHLKTNSPVTVTNTTCDLVFTVQSNELPSSTSPVPTSIKLVPDTSGTFAPFFKTGTPPQGMYNQNYNYTQSIPLTEMIISNRSGGQEPLGNFSKGTPWNCDWLDLDSSKQNLIQTRTPQWTDTTKDASPCEISVNVSSLANGDTAVATANSVMISPDTITPFSPAFKDGTPPPGIYNTPYSQDLTTMIVSNRQGDQLNSTFTNFSSPSCSWLTLPDGKTLQGTLQATAPYTGDIQCPITVSATSTSVNSSTPTPVNGTVTIKPDMTQPFGLVVTQPTIDVLYGEKYTLNLYNSTATNPFIYSSRPGEPLATPFNLKDTTCKNPDGTNWITIDNSTNNLESTDLVPVIKGLTSCTVTLTVSSAYPGSTDSTDTTFTLNLVKNPDMSPNWVSTAAPACNLAASNNNIITNAGVTTTFALNNCINSVNKENNPVFDNSITFSGTATFTSGSSATIDGNNLVATPSTKDLGTTLSNFPLKVSSQAYDSQALKSFTLNLWVQYYIIQNATAHGLPIYNTTYSSYLYIQNLSPGVPFEIVNYDVPNTQNLMMCPGLIDPTQAWNPDYQSHPTCIQYYPPGGYVTFTPDSSNNASLVFVGYSGGTIKSITIKKP